MGVLLAVLTATRLPGILYVFLCGFEYLRSYNWSLKRAFNPLAGWFLLAPLGFVAYGIALYIIRQDALGMLAAYQATDDWSYHIFNINFAHTLWVSVSSGVTGLIETRAYEHFVNKLLPMASLTLLLGSSLYLFLQKKAHYLPPAIVGVLSIILFSLNSNVVSVHRYALACICIFIAMAVYCRTPKRLFIVIALCIINAVVQLFLYTKFINDIFAG